MKLIMESWRGFLKQEEIFEDHEYITNVLGITLPLDESGRVRLTEEVRGQILQEHLLCESFIGSLVSGAKESAGKIKDLLLALAKILQDGEALKSFVNLLASKVIKPIANQFRKAFNKMKEAGGKIAQLVEKISEMFEALLEKFGGMTGGWKKAMAGCTLALLLKYAYDKVSGVIEDVISGAITDEFVAFLTEQFVKMFGQDLLEKVMGHVANIKSYLGWIGPIVGGVSFVAQTLVPVTSRMKVTSL